MARRRWIVPEVVQTSAMDCGPASLKALLEGFYVPVSYGRLREACQTDVDGTSIDTLEDIARQLGMDSEQVIVPTDHVLLPESGYLPALIVVRHPDGQTHFVVVWSRVGPWVQVMDPGLGRRWMRVDRFLADLYQHAMFLPASAVRAYLRSRRFLAPLRSRLRTLGLSRVDIDRAVTAADAETTGVGIPALDAATRMLTSLVSAGGLRAGAEARGLLEALLARIYADPRRAVEVIPRLMWFALPYDEAGADEPAFGVRGSVMVRIGGPRSALPPGDNPLDLPETEDPLADREAPSPSEPLPPPPPEPPLPPALAAALQEAPSRPLRTLVQTLAADGVLAPSIVLGATLISAGGVLVEAALMRGLFDIGASLTLGAQRAAAIGLLLAFGVGLLLVEWALQVLSLRMGRNLELRLRVAFQQKIPRLGDRYLQSRPTSDMAERSHSAHVIRSVPSLGIGLLRATLGLLFTAAGIVWLDPGLAPLAGIAVLASVGLPMIIQPLLTERDLRFRTHLGSLSRFYLDALLGLTTIRTHGAELSVRRQHEALLTAWTGAGLDAQRVAVGVEGAQALAGFSIAGGLLASYLHQNPAGGGALLLAWWALALPALGQAVALSARQYPAIRNVTLRLLEPLGAPEETDGLQSHPAPEASTTRGARVQLEGVAVRAAGHTILEGLNLSVEPGEHVAIVGASGAGKSSLLGLLLGWHRAAEGRVLVDGEPLEGDRLARLRRETAWVDPAVQLWNQPFLDNLLYGAEGSDAAELGAAIDAADLREVLERLPDGLSTRLGEGGALLSGGQGQRVRLGRAALRANARLVLLDEPFRGLDRDRRHALLGRARRRWAEATFVCVTHDVGDTFDFPRVMVVDGGRVVEDGPPGALAADPSSRYRALLDAEQAVRSGLWGGPDWRRLFMANGQLIERGPEGRP